MRLIWCKQARKWVEPSELPRARVHLKADSMDAFESPVTGEIIGSRGQWDRHLKANGHHISEPGDVAGKPKRDVRPDVKRALQQMGVVG